MWDERLDETIDAAARQLTDGEPGGELKARVLARLEARGHHRFRTLGWILAPGAIAAAAIVVVISLNRPKARTDIAPPAVPAAMADVQSIPEVQGVQGLPRVQAVHEVQS